MSGHLREEASHTSCQATESSHASPSMGAEGHIDGEKKASNIPPRRDPQECVARSAALEARTQGGLGWALYELQSEKQSAYDEQSTPVRATTPEQIDIGNRRRRGFSATISANLYGDRDVSSIFITSCPMWLAPMSPMTHRADVIAYVLMHPLVLRCNADATMSMRGTLPSV